MLNRSFRLAKFQMMSNSSVYPPTPLTEIGGTLFHELSAKSDSTLLDSQLLQLALENTNALSLCPNQENSTNFFANDPFDAKRTTGLIVTPDQHEVILIYT
jgi:hypothetical protein